LVSYLKSEFDFGWLGGVFTVVFAFKDLGSNIVRGFGVWATLGADLSATVACPFALGGADLLTRI